MSMSRFCLNRIRRTHSKASDWTLPLASRKGPGYLAELRRLGRPDLLETDLKEQRFLLMTLQTMTSFWLIASDRGIGMTHDFV